MQKLTPQALQMLKNLDFGKLIVLHTNITVVYGIIDLSDCINKNEFPTETIKPIAEYLGIDKLKDVIEVQG